MLKKLNKKYFTFVFASFMSFLMSGIISLCITTYEYGLTSTLVSQFFKAWQVAFPVAFVVAQFVAPVVRKMTSKFVEQ